MAGAMRVVGRGPGPVDLSNVRRKNTSFLYSARLLPATLAVASYPFFVTAVGNIGQGFAGALSFTETNLTNPNRIPDQTGYIIRRLGFHWTPLLEAGTSGCVDTVASLQRCLNYSNIQFVKTEYSFTFGPSFLLPAGAGVWGFSSGAAATLDYGTNGVPTPQARFELKVPLVLKPGETFSFNLNVTTAITQSTATKAWIILEGESFSAVAS